MSKTTRAKFSLPGTPKRVPPWPLLFISAFLLNSAFAQEDKAPVVELVMDGPVYAVPMPKYPFDEETVMKIRESLQLIPDFTIREVYYGNNQSYVPCLSVKLNLKTVKAVDSAFVRTIQEKILACFPDNSGSVITLMYFKDKPFLVARASKGYSQIIYHPVDSVKGKVMKMVPDMKRLLVDSDMKTHRIEAAYVGLKIAERTSLSYVEVWLQTSNEKGERFLCRYKPPYESGRYKQKSELEKPILLTQQTYGFSADIKEMIQPPNPTIRTYLYYLTPTGDMVEKALSYVDESSERYTEYFLKVF